MLKSPLCAVFLVIALLALMLIPLQHITAERTQSAVDIYHQTVENKIHAVIKIKSLQPIQNLILKSSKGEILYEVESLQAGESEHDIEINIEDHEILLDASLRFSGGEESAIFFTLMPDQFVEKTAYILGSGERFETLHFSWKEER